uniref:TNase-like domain-containing protein n=1 Tax=Amphora coffeiformis TaxID=265554 RepID=A0A7S3KXR0_9STRA|eukprot:scaffold1001_cov169-Amphora_coffeaeformis.AAC.26
MGTRLCNVKLTEVVDGDTLKVELVPGQEETLRLIGVDTEESAIGSKPVTNAGQEASKLACAYFGCDEQGFPPPQADVRIDIEFDTLEPKHVCLKQHRGHWGRLLCYVYLNEENYNIMTVKHGWSPYFVKFGRSKLFHHQFLKAEAQAQAEQKLIWDPHTNDGGNSRDYTKLLPWWHLRDSVLQEYYTKGLPAGVLAFNRDFTAITEAAKHKDEICVLCDLAKGITNKQTKGALCDDVGTSTTQNFSLWIPNTNNNAHARAILNLIETRYAGDSQDGRGGRGYVFVTGEAELHNGNPRIVLTSVSQLSDVPPGSASA